MKILGLTSGHDAAACVFVDGKLVSYCKQERLSRIKNHAGRSLHQECIPEALEIAGVSAAEIDIMALGRSRFPANCFHKSYRPFYALMRKVTRRSLKIYTEMREQQQADEFKILNADCLKRHVGLRADAKVSFTNHHYAHALGAFKFTDWQQDALYITGDGAGDGVSYSAYYFDGKSLQQVVGGDDFIFRKKFNFAASIGIAYSFVTQALGFRANRHEGKITGLAAFGQPVFAEDLQNRFKLNDDFLISSSFKDQIELKNYLFNLAKTHSREDMAASIQAVTEGLMVDWVQSLLKKYPAKFVGMSGGLFANVRLNQKIAELQGIEEVYVFPAMSDEGLSVGNCVDQEILRNGISALDRYLLNDVYFGKSYSGQELLATAKQQQLHVVESNEVADFAAELLSRNAIGAIFNQRMEMGPRALGARSIIASPAQREINNTLNERLQRTEFMPFAPYVLAEDAAKVFKIDKTNWQACRFMTITTDVLDEYKDLISAVVHVDGTARPQIIDEKTNPLYYGILKQFKAKTSIPCLVNTSFNAHEEPIINTPAEAINSLQENRIDFLVCEAGFVFRSESEMKVLQAGEKIKI